MAQITNDRDYAEKQGRQHDMEPLAKAEESENRTGQDQRKNHCTLPGHSGNEQDQGAANFKDADSRAQPIWVTPACELSSCGGTQKLSSAKSKKHERQKGS